MLIPKSKLQDNTSFQVMRILKCQPDITQRELAEQLGISLGGINYCLKALSDKGLVKIVNFSNSKHKFGYIYVLTPKGLAEKAVLTSLFLKRKIKEYEALKTEIETLQFETDPTLKKNQLSLNDR